MTDDERRSAALLFEPELAGGKVEEDDLLGPEVLKAVRSRPVPSRPVRLAQALAAKRRGFAYEERVIEPQAAARRAVLGDAAAAPPRLLVRMDEFPHAEVMDRPDRYGDETFRRFHEIMAGAGVPYLLAVLPRPCRHYLDPEAQGDRPLTDTERELLARACAEGAEPAVHGLTHRTRDASPRRHSELCGLSEAALAELLDTADAELAGSGLRPRTFVPPFNRFDARQYPQLARRFDVVCSGPETVRLMGYQSTPLVRDGAVYVPSYPPLYGTAAAILPAVRRLIERQPGTWVPLTLHLGWEADRGWSDLERLASAVAPYARPWGELTPL